MRFCTWGIGSNSSCTFHAERRDLSMFVILLSSGTETLRQQTVLNSCVCSIATQKEKNEHVLLACKQVQDSVAWFRKYHQSHFWKGQKPAHPALTSKCQILNAKFQQHLLQHCHSKVDCTRHIQGIKHMQKNQQIIYQQHMQQNQQTSAGLSANASAIHSSYQQPHSVTEVHLSS